MAAKGKGRGGNVDQVEEEAEEEQEADVEPVAEEGRGGAQFQLQKGRPAKPTLGMWSARPATKIRNRFSKLAPVAEDEDQDVPGLCDSDPGEQKEA